MLIFRKSDLQRNLNNSRAEVDHLQSTQQQTVSATGSEVEQQMQHLREDLAQAQDEAESLRASAAANTALAAAPLDAGSKSIAEQVAEHVEAVRVELNVRHDERLRHADEILANRTNQMKASLSKKLTEGKNQIRQNLTTEHEQAIEALRNEHQREMDQLTVRHKNELDEVRRLVEATGKASAAAQNTDGSSDVKTEDQMPSVPYQPSEAEARVLVQSNETIRSILRQNVSRQVTKAKEDVAAQMQKDYEKSLADIQEKSKSAIEHAVVMEGKKNALQINMATNKFKIAQFRIDLIQKSSQESPEKPVTEVWASVKDAKPPTNATQQPLQKPPTANPFGQPTAASQAVANQKPPQSNDQGAPSAISTSGRPTPAAPAPRVSSPTIRKSPQQVPAQPKAQGEGSGISTFGKPTPTAPAIPTAQIQAPTGPQSSQNVQAQANVVHSNQGPSQQSGTSQTAQQKPPTNPSNTGTGSSAPKGLQQSGLPVARGGSIRGNSNLRGRGSGMGRGDPPLNTNQIQGQPGRGSPIAGGLNAGAKQFVPGNKRPRDDSQETQQSDGKRIRGGGSGA